MTKKNISKTQLDVMITCFRLGFEACQSAKSKEMAVEDFKRNLSVLGVKKDG